MTNLSDLCPNLGLFPDLYHKYWRHEMQLITGLILGGLLVYVVFVYDTDKNAPGTQSLGAKIRKRLISGLNWLIARLEVGQMSQEVTDESQ